VHRFTSFAVIVKLFDRHDKPVPSFGYSLDILLVSGRIPQQLAQGRDVNRQIGIFYKSVRPHLLHHLVLGQQPPVAFNKNDEDLKSLRGQRNSLAFAEKKMFCGIAAEPAEFV
jgi:hypothetical protein